MQILRHACIALLALAPLSAQQFDVASVKPTPANPSGAIFFFAATGGPGTADPTHIRWNSATLKSVLMTAYDVKNYQVSAPGWFDSERYDFAVTVPEGATKAEVGVMWQQLLAERFGLVLHHESREFQVDELVVARGGHKLKETEMAGPAPEGPPKVENGKLVGPGLVTFVFPGPGGARGELTAVAQGLSGLVTLLSNQLGHPVVDKTGLTGQYDFTLEFAVSLPGMQLPGAPPAAAAAQGLTPPDPALDLGSAVQQKLGLRLEKGKAPLDVIVVDKAEKVPTEN
jgi:uncharacterized protein (TIGR03435 family)